MSDHELPPLDADLRSLLAGARGIAPAPAGAEARVLARVVTCALARGESAAGSRGSMMGK